MDGSYQRQTRGSAAEVEPLEAKAVTVQKLTYGQVAARYGVSKTLVHTLHHRWLAEGEGT